jgi:acetolactate synthase-1/2/3 large subunit
MQAMTEVHGGAAVIEVLRAFGVTEFFNVPGESFLPILDALRTEPSIHLVTNRHESGAAFAADGFAKMSGRTAVCMATRGPGASNLSIGVQTSLYDSTPMVALIGLIPTALQGSQAFQEFDPISMYASLAKRTLVVGARESLETTIAQALVEAGAGRPGPVVVGIPTDLLSAKAPLASFGFPETRGSAKPDIQLLVDHIRAASHPAFVMSTAAVRGSCAADIENVSSRLAAPVFCGWRRFSAFDNSHPSFAGSLGLGASPGAIATLGQADLVVALGRLDPVTIDSGRLNRPGLVVVTVAEVVDPHLARRLPLARVVQVASPPEVVAQLLAREVEQIPAAKHRRGSAADGAGSTGLNLTADSPMSRLNQSAPGDAVIVSDAGEFAQALLCDFQFDRMRSFIGPVNGAMGYGLPGAIGAQLAYPDRPVFCVAGDGGLLMTVGEMETATRLGIDLTVVVFNNSAYGTIRSRQEEAFPGHEFGTLLGDVCFTEIAQAMGWHAWPAQSTSQFESALANAANSSGCRLIEVGF